LLAHAHVSRGETDDRRDRTARDGKKAQEERGEPRKYVSGASENSNIAPGIEILFHREQENVRSAGAVEQLGAIRVSFPAHVAEQCAIGSAKRDQITAAAMVRTEDQLLRRQLIERLFDIAGAKAGAIAAHRNDLVVTELCHPLDRVFEALGKIASGLAMNMGTGNARVSGGREKMNVNRWGKFAGKCRKIQEWSRGHRERAARQLDMHSLGEEENGASGHAFGYETV
jgi:hypothetical protein